MNNLKQVGDTYTVYVKGSMLRERGHEVATVLEVDSSETGSYMPYLVSVSNTGLKHWCYANGDSNVGTFEAVDDGTTAVSDGTSPCEEAGYAVGDKFTYLGGLWFENGATITLVEDDGTDCPRFEADPGHKMYLHLTHVEPLTEVDLVDEADLLDEVDLDDEAERTPCEEAGYAEGDKFTYLKDYWFDSGTVITLVEDDGTDCPCFEDEYGKRIFIHLEHVNSLERKPVGFQYHIVYGGDVALATIVRQQSDGGYRIEYEDVFSDHNGTHSVLSNGDSNIGAFKAIDFNR
jgi:hypothetical protein